MLQTLFNVVLAIILFPFALGIIGAVWFFIAGLLNPHIVKFLGDDLEARGAYRKN